MPYGFTAADLNFILNYDIKHRHGRDTESEEEREVVTREGGGRGVWANREAGGAVDLQHAGV